MKITFHFNEGESRRGYVLADGESTEFTWSYRGIRVDLRKRNLMFGSYMNRATAGNAVKRYLRREGSHVQRNQNVSDP